MPNGTHLNTTATIVPIKASNGLAPVGATAVVKCQENYAFDNGYRAPQKTVQCVAHNTWSDTTNCVESKLQSKNICNAYFYN